MVELPIFRSFLDGPILPALLLRPNSPNPGSLVPAPPPAPPELHLRAQTPSVGASHMLPGHTASPKSHLLTTPEWTPVHSCVRGLFQTS